MQKKTKTTIVILSVTILASILTSLFYQVNSPRRFVAGQAALLLALCLAGFVLYKMGIENVQIYLLMAIAFVSRATYTIVTPTWVRQHDVIGFGNEFGQAAFIEYFYNHFGLIDFDPRQLWGFFQPPLHHMLAALWLHLNVWLGFAYNHACENVQVLTLLYSIVMTYFACKILKEFDLKGMPLYVSFGICALHPCFILMAGSINNDMLCILLQVMAMYFLLRWTKNEKIGTIVVLALCVGGSMMAKLSGVLIAPAVAAVFLYQLIKGRRRWLVYIKQFVIFGVVSIPIGIWSPVRNFVKFGVPLNYTPEVGEPVQGFGILRRIFDIRTGTPYTCLIDNGNTYDEFNIPLSLLKTSLVGEYNYSKSPLILPFAWILLITGAVLAIAAFVLTVYYLFWKKSPLTFAARLFLGIYYLTSMVFYLNLCFSIPNFSSQDFRYIAYLIVVEAVFLGIYFADSSKAGVHIWLKRILLVTSAAFCVSSVTVYLLLGLIQN